LTENKTTLDGETTVCRTYKSNACRRRPLGLTHWQRGHTQSIIESMSQCLVWISTVSQ